MYDFYIAAPFFNEYQIEVVEKIKKILSKCNFSYFSPKDECEILEGRKSTIQQRLDVFLLNCRGMDYSGRAIVVIDDFDKGVIWEWGYLFARRKRVFAYTDFPERGLNIMLELSCEELVHGEIELEEYLGSIRSDSKVT